MSLCLNNIRQRIVVIVMKKSTFKSVCTTIKCSYSSGTCTTCQWFAAQIVKISSNVLIMSLQPFTLFLPPPPSLTCAKWHLQQTQNKHTRSELGLNEVPLSHTWDTAIREEFIVQARYTFFPFFILGCIGTKDADSKSHWWALTSSVLGTFTNATTLI